MCLSERRRRQIDKYRQRTCLSVCLSFCLLCVPAFCAQSFQRRRKKNSLKLARVAFAEERKKRRKLIFGYDCFSADFNTSELNTERALFLRRKVSLLFFKILRNAYFFQVDQLLCSVTLIHHHHLFDWTDQWTLCRSTHACVLHLSKGSIEICQNRARPVLET